MPLRQILRKLAGSPAFTTVAVATLALGIGICTVVFTVYDAVAFRPLPVRSPETVVRLGWRTSVDASDLFSWTEYERLRESAGSITALVAASTPQSVLCTVPGSGASSPTLLRVRFVSANYFDALGVHMQIGRAFFPNDTAVAVASHRFWTNRFGSRRELPSAPLDFRNGLLNVVGVAPAGFAGTGAPPEEPNLWIIASAQTISMPGADWTRSNIREWQILGRKMPNTAQELPLLSAHWPREEGNAVTLTIEKATFFETGRGAFATFSGVCGVLMIAVALVLLIGCINLTHLVAARNTGRQHEIALRVALGATRRQLLQLLCGESLIVGLLGGCAGFVLSVWICGFLEWKAPDIIQKLTNGAFGLAIDLSPDWRVFVWAAVVSVMTGVAVGVLPAFRATCHDANHALKQGTSVAGGGLRSRRNRNVMLTIQVASCLVLLAGAGLLFRGASRSANIHPGFDYKHLAMIAVDARGLASTADARIGLEKKAIGQIERIPGIVSVSWADRAPFLGTGAGPFVSDNGAALGCMFNGVSDTYFTTLGVRILAGRTFTTEEIHQRAPVALVSEATARRLWPRQDPLGKTLSPSTDWLARTLEHSFAHCDRCRAVCSEHLFIERRSRLCVLAGNAAR